MIEYAILHYPESKYCFALDNKTVELRIRIARVDNPDIYVIYGGKYDYSLKRKSIKMERCYTDRLYAYYKVKIKLYDPRLVYIFKIVEGNNNLYYSEDGLTKKYNFKLNFYNSFQYAYVNSCDVMEEIPWLKNASFYQNFIDRFNIGNRNKDMSYINTRWGDKPTPHSFTGGDIKGITEKLNYIKKLGINAIYLTPIFKSISNHKYDISDYYNIDSMFGDKEDLHELITKAHSLGIRIVLDAVFNHASENLKEFQDVLKNKEKSKYYNWFIIKNDEPLDYECFAACKYMPKLNTSNKEVQNYLINIGSYWIKEFDIDGWRLDVSDEVSHEFWRLFRLKIKECKSDAVLIGENWHDASQYLNGDQYDSIMNYAFTKASLDFFAFNKFNASDMANKLNSILMRNNTNANNMMLNLLDSHDTLRFYTELKCNGDRLDAALALLFMFPGVPCIYYGTENRMEGGYDPDSRRCMDWNLEFKNNPTKLLIRRLTSLKRKIKDSDVRIYSSDGLLIVDRLAKNNLYRLVINNSSHNIKYISNSPYAANLYADSYIRPDGFLIDKI